MHINSAIIPSFFSIPITKPIFVSSFHYEAAVMNQLLFLFLGRKSGFVNWSQDP